MQDTVCGVRFEGDWEELANWSETVTTALEQTASEDEELEDWEEWRPRESESMEEDHREKTVEKACMDEENVKPHDADPSDDVGEAVAEASDAVDEVTKGRIRGATSRIAVSIHRAGRSIYTATKAGFRRFEAAVYHHIMTRTNPHYFDSDLVSASVESKGSLLDDDKIYKLTVNLNDRERIKEFQDHIKALN